MTTEFHDEALLEYHSSAVYSESAFGLGEEFVRAIERALSENFLGSTTLQKIRPTPS